MAFFLENGEIDIDIDPGWKSLRQPVVLMPFDPCWGYKQKE